MGGGGVEQQKRPHAVMIPYPYQGHVTPFVYLAIKLASTAGFTVTFVNTHHVHSQISKSGGGGGDWTSGLDIRYVTVSDGFPLGFDRSLNHDQFKEGLLHVFSAHVDEVVGDLARSADPPVTCLIADTFFTWTSLIAGKYDLVNVSFWTEPALVLCLYYHLDLLHKNGHFAAAQHQERNCKGKDMIEYIPGVKAIEPRDLMSYLQSTDTSTVMHRIISKAFADVKKADIIICNTVQELEPDAVGALSAAQPTYSIGPVFPTTPITTSLLFQSDCSHWLDSKPPASVLYVSFSSYAHTSEADILEIAHGLILSGAHFLWVLRPDIVSSDRPLPTRFLTDLGNNSAGRGLVVPWCRQPEVLSHPSVRGFLTHCGWNSILESLWCAIPLLCYPLVTDQFSNRKLLVNDWKVGVDLCASSPIARLQIADSIRAFMSESCHVQLKRAVLRLKATLEDALATVAPSAAAGSSTANFNAFVEDVTTRSTTKLQLHHGRRPKPNSIDHCSGSSTQAIPANISLHFVPPIITACTSQPRPR